MLYFLDWKELDRPEQVWVQNLLELQYRFRQASWVIKHFLTLRYTRPKAGPYYLGHVAPVQPLDREWRLRIENRHKLMEV